MGRQKKTGWGRKGKERRGQQHKEAWSTPKWHRSPLLFTFASRGQAACACQALGAQHRWHPLVVSRVLGKQAQRHRANTKEHEARPTMEH